MKLRYGTNPQQSGATATPVVDGTSPVRLINGEPSMINMLDALNGWQLVQQASTALGKVAAASFKHVSPAGAAVAGPIDDVAAATYRTDALGVGDVTSAYVRARDADPRSSFGDFAAVSHPVDLEFADLLAGVVCDGVIAPGFEPGTIERLRTKKNGRFLIIEADDGFVPPMRESREVFGLRLTEDHDTTPLSSALLEHTTGQLPDTAVEDLLLGLIVLRFTPSNSVCYVRGGTTLGIGAGQQSRVDCTRLAGAKVDTWWLRRHPVIRDLRFGSGVRRQERINWQIRAAEGNLTLDESRRFRDALDAPPEDLSDADRFHWLEMLDDVCFTSDGYLPFRDNVDYARRHGVRYIAEPGGSVRSEEVERACQEHDIALVQTGVRLFHH